MNISRRKTIQVNTVDGIRSSAPDIHLLSEIELMCNRIGIIKNGELLTTQYIQEPLQSNDLETLSVKLEVDSINDTVNLIQANHVTKTEIKDTYIFFDCLKKVLSSLD